MKLPPLGVFVLSAMAAQTQDSGPPKFEVASIKSSHDTSTETWVMQDQSGNLTTHNATLKGMILFAYGVREHQVIGGPSWLDSARFDIVAKPPARGGNAAEFRQLVQALLAERFGLKVHPDSRELPIYTLIVAKGGPKLIEWKEGVGPTCHYQGGELTCRKVSMVILGDELSRKLGRSVVDRTGLTGSYDLKLIWTPDEFQVPGPAEIGQVQTGAPGGPSLMKALQEQLGLRLEADKGPVPVVVIDSAEKPTEN